MKDKKGIIKALYMSAVVFTAHYFSGFLEQMVVEGNNYAWVLLFVWYAAFLYIGEKIFDKY
jgi:hypothetical protein